MRTFAAVQRPPKRRLKSPIGAPWAKRPHHRSRLRGVGQGGQAQKLGSVGL